MKKTLKIVSVSMALASLLLAGCSTESDFVSFNPSNAQPLPSATPTPVIPVNATIQVEQLARPAINEGLLVTNSFLNTYNSVGPAFVRAALTNSTSPEGTAAGPLLAQATSNLAAFVALNTTITGPAINTTVTAIVGALLPDVMRIDTTVNVSLAQEAFNSTVNNVGSPVAGRKLTDDVIDTVLQVATQGAVTSDGVPYYRPPGNTNQAIGHDFLNGQTAPFGASQFPFLAPAN
jgi:hypothetical protein